MSAIGLVTCDDWSALYIDGFLVEDNSSLCVGHVLERLVGKTIDSFESVYVGNAFEETGDMPRSFEEAKRHKQQ